MTFEEAIKIALFEGGYPRRKEWRENVTLNIDKDGNLELFEYDLKRGHELLLSATDIKADDWEIRE